MEREGGLLLGFGLDKLIIKRINAAALSQSFESMSQVFISYRQENDAHSARVRELALRLRAAKVEVTLDSLVQEELFHGNQPPNGWGPWSIQQASQAPSVVVVASSGWFRGINSPEPLLKGKGSAAEAICVFQRLYNEAPVNNFAVIVYFDPDKDLAEMPPFFEAKCGRFHAASSDDFGRLLIWLRRPASAQTAASSAKTSVGAAGVGRPPPLLLPPAASEYFGRSDLVEELASRLRRRQRVDVWGGPGMGKTALAAEAVRKVVGENQMSLAGSLFPDGVVFLDMYRYKDDMPSAWQALANAFDDRLSTNQLAQDRARMACAGRRALVILEGAEELGWQLNDFVSVLAAENTLLVLTRDEKQTLASRRIRLDDLLEEENALALLRSLSGASVQQEILAAIQRHLGGHPLALTWAGSQLADQTQPPREFLKDLEAEALKALTEPAGKETHTLKWMFGRSLRHLDKPTRKVLGAAGRIGSVPFGVSLAKAVGADKAALQRLTQLSFLRLSDDQQGWQFFHVLAAQYARDLPLPRGWLPALGQWVSAELKLADTRYGRGGGHFALDQALLHATTLLTHDHTGSVLRHLVGYLLDHDVENNTIGVRHGRLDFARRALQAIDAWLQHAPASLRDTDAWQRDVSVVLDRIGAVSREQGDLVAALDAYNQGKVIAEKLAQNDSGNAIWQRDLAISLNKLGDVLLQQKDFDAALQAYQRSRGICEKLLQNNPTRTNARRDLSLSLERIGEVSLELDDLIGAMQVFQESYAIAANLVQQNPDNVVWQRDLSVSLEQIGTVMQKQGDLAGALRAYEEGHAIAEKLAENDSGDVGWQRDLSYWSTKIAQLFINEGRWSDALPLADRSLQIDERLAVMDSSNATWQKDVKVSRRMLAEIQEHLKKG